MPRNPIVISLIAASTVLYGCAFKNAGRDAVAANSPEPQTATEPVAVLRAAWWLGESSRSQQLSRTLKMDRGRQVLRSLSPITLPKSVPNRLDLEISLPVEVTEALTDWVLVQWLANGESPRTLNAKQIQIASKDSAGLTLLFTVDQLRDLLPDTQERSGQLRILVQKPSGEILATLLQEFRTAPSALSITDGPPSSEDFEAIDERATRVLNVGRQRYDLLRVIRIKSQSSYPISAAYSLSARSRLTLKRWKYDVRDAGTCATDATLETLRLPITDKTWVLPLEPKTAANAARLLTDPQESVVQESAIASEMTLRLGIYGSADGISELANGDFDGAKPSTRQIVDHCESRCPRLRTGSSEAPACWNGWFYRAGESRVSRAQVQQCMDCAAGNQQACEGCRGWEERVKPWTFAGPNCLFCGELVQTGSYEGHPLYQALPQWRSEAVMVEAKIGQEDKSILLESDAANTLIGLRFGDNRAEDDPASRSMPFMRAVTELWKKE